MSNLSDFGERKFIDYALRNQSAPATTYYLGVSTSAFAEDVTPSNAASQEPSDSAYQRQTISFGTASSRTISNLSDIEFAEATASQGSIGYWAIFDGSGSTANTVAQGSFTTAKTVATGDVLRVATGDLDISVSSIWGLHWGNALLNGFFDADDATGSTNTYGQFKDSDSASIFDTVGNSYNYRQYSQYYLAVSTSQFDATTSDTQYFNGASSPTTYLNTSNAWTTDEKANILLEPWAGSTTALTYSGFDSLEDTNGYARTSISFSAASTSSGTTTMVNSAAVSFPEATASWGSIGYWAIFAQGPLYGVGNWTDQSKEKLFNAMYPIMIGSFTTAKTIATGDVLRINAGDFILTPQ